MSQFYDQSSLVFLPSGYKDGKLYSQKPLSTSGELSFSRGSDIEATRVNANGYIEKAQVNLLLQSNTFNTTWVKGGSLTSGQSGYDGSSNAWLYTTTAAGQRIEQSTTITGVQTISVYAKAGNLDWILLNIGGGVFGAYFDLANGVVGSTQSASGGVTIDTKIQAIGSGWYRISVSGNYSSASSFRIYTASADLVTAAGTIYIQDAQLNYGLVAQTYQETTTAAVVSGITDNMPRLSYDPANPTCPHLILEPSRQNLVPHSDYIGSLVPEKGTITSNADTSPEGVLNATSFVEDSTTGRHRTSFFVSVTSGQTYTFSMFAKIKSGTRLLCINNAATIGARAYFNLVSGAVESVDSGTASIEDYGDGWFRCSVTAQSSVTGSATTYFGLEDGTADNGYTGDGTSGHYWYGLQLEAASYASSLIPTYGSSATRTADACSKTGISSLIGQTSGGIFVDFEFNNFESGYDWFGLSAGGTTANRLILGVTDSSTQGYRLFVVSGGTTSIDSRAGNTTAYGRQKAFVKYDAGSYKVFVNGSKIIDTTGVSSFAASLTEFRFDDTGTLDFYSPVNQTLLFTSALSDAECITLTSL